MRPDSFTPRSRFTLIELLTVVAILAILMAMLFPSLHLAKRKARTLGCVINLRFQGLAYMSYIDDNSAQFPRSHPLISEKTDWLIGGKARTGPRDPISHAAGRLLNSYAGVNETVNPNNPLSVKFDGQLYCTHATTHADHLKSEVGIGVGDGRQIFNCPGDIGSQPGFGDYGPVADANYLTDNDLWFSTTHWDKFGSRSYVYNDLGNNNIPANGHGLQYIQLQEVVDASYTVMSACLSGAGNYGNSMGNANQAPKVPYYYTYWHSSELSEGPNMFVDGSVRTIKLWNNWGGSNNSPRLYGKQNIPADFNWCFREYSVGYDWKNHTNGY